jgi:hypothetical protein
MNTYQRKTLLIIIAINVVFGLQQYLINKAVVFPSPLNAFIFFVATLYFFLKTVFKATKTEKILMVLFLVTAMIQLLSDTFFLELILSGQHATVSEWFNSANFDMIQLFGVASLLATIPLIGKNLRSINTSYFFVMLFFFATLCSLAFIKIPVEPLILLAFFVSFLIYLLFRYNERIYAGVSAAMHLWIIFFLNEVFEYSNLML